MITSEFEKAKTIIINSLKVRLWEEIESIKIFTSETEVSENGRSLEFAKIHLDWAEQINKSIRYIESLEEEPPLIYKSVEADAEPKDIGDGISFTSIEHPVNGPAIPDDADLSPDSIESYEIDIPLSEAEKKLARIILELEKVYPEVMGRIMRESNLTIEELRQELQKES
jgi:hypothetical protein